MLLLLFLLLSFFFLFCHCLGLEIRMGSVDDPQCLWSIKCDDSLLGRQQLFSNALLWSVWESIPSSKSLPKLNMQNLLRETENKRKEPYLEWKHRLISGCLVTWKEGRKRVKLLKDTVQTEPTVPYKPYFSSQYHQFHHSEHLGIKCVFEIIQNCQGGP